MGTLDELDEEYGIQKMKMNQFESDNKPGKTSSSPKQPKKAKKRGKAAKNMLIVGQNTLDIFGFRVKKKESSEKAKSMLTLAWDEELLIEEYILEKEFRLSRVARLKKTFLERCMSKSGVPLEISRVELSCGKMIVAQIKTSQSVQNSAYESAEQESGVLEQEYDGRVHGCVVGSNTTILQDQDDRKHVTILDREKCVRYRCAVYDDMASQAQDSCRHEKRTEQGTNERIEAKGGTLVGRTSCDKKAAVSIFESPVLKKIVNRKNTVAQILNRFGGGHHTHFSGAR